MKLPIQVIKDDVSQQRRDDPALRSTPGCRFKDTVVHYPGSEKFFNELQDVAVSDLSRDTLHNQFVRDVIKESFDIGIQHELVTVGGVFQHLFDGHVAVTARPEAVRVIMKLLFEDRLDQASDDFLGDPASNGGNTERSKFAASLWDIHPF